MQACLAKDPAGRPTAAQVRGLLRSADAGNQAAGEPTQIISAPTLVGLTPDATMPRGMPPVRPPAPQPGFVAYAPPPVAPPAGRPAWLIPVAVVVAVLLVAGIAVAVVRFAGTAATTAVGPTADPVATAPAASPTSDPAADASVVDAATDGRFGTGGARFASPSRNIACAMTAEQVRCDVAQNTWQLPPKPAGCAAAYGKGAVLAGSGKGELSCISDTVADPALPVLPYDQGVRFAGVVCTSLQTGLRCTNTATEHGFRLARASYDLF